MYFLKFTGEQELFRNEIGEIIEPNYLNKLAAFMSAFENIHSLRGGYASKDMNMAFSYMTEDRNNDYEPDWIDMNGPWGRFHRIKGVFTFSFVTEDIFWDSKIEFSEKRYNHLRRRSPQDNYRNYIESHPPSFFNHQSLELVCCSSSQISAEKINSPLEFFKPLRIQIIKDETDSLTLANLESRALIAQKF